MNNDLRINLAGNTDQIYPKQIARLDKERLSNPMGNEIRMSCLNAAALINYFLETREVSKSQLINDLSVDINYLNDEGNWLNNIDTFRLYYNCQHSVTGLTHKEWAKIGANVYRHNISRTFKALMRLLSLKQIYTKIPRYNKRMNRWSRYTIIDIKKNLLRYKYEILEDKIRSLYSIGCECYWHAGILSSIPKIQNPKNAFSSTTHEICGMPIHTILENCYHIFSPRYQYTDEGLALDGDLAGKWIRFTIDSKSRRFFTKEFEYSDHVKANALVLIKDISMDGVSIFSEGEIYNAPYCIFSVKYNDINIVKRLLVKQSVLADGLERQLEITERKFQEANALRCKEKMTREELAKAHAQLKKYTEELEQIVEKRTAKLIQTQIKLGEAEKRILENRITGGFAHEMRNALAGAQLEFRAVLDYKDNHKAATDLLKECMTDLLITITDFHNRYKIPKKHITESCIPKIKTIVQIAEDLSETIWGVSKDLDRALSITNQIREYSKLAEIKAGHDRVELIPLLKSYARRYRQDFHRHNIQYFVNNPGQIILMVDETHLDSILNNLILNAMDAIVESGKSDGTIKVIVHGETQVVTIEIQDNGCGISDSDINEIFEPFFSTKPTNGTGLGLGVVKRLLNLYGGNVSVNSKVGDGTTFKIEFPIM